jgi:hypothetical protein
MDKMTLLDWYFAMMPILFALTAIVIQLTRIIFALRRIADGLHGLRSAISEREVSHFLRK